MLVLSRKLNEVILIGDDIEIKILGHPGRVGSQVKIGIIAPRGVPVHRKEAQERIKAQKEG